MNFTPFVGYRRALPYHSFFVGAGTGNKSGAYVYNYPILVPPRRFLWVHAREREELEIILLVEPPALEIPQRQSGSSRKGESIHRELHVRMGFLSCVGFVVEDMDVAVADLQEINMARDYGAVESQVESLHSVVLDIRFSQENGYLDSHCNGIIDEHETLQCFVPLPVVERSRKGESGHASRVILFASDLWLDFGRKFGGAVLG